MTVAVSPRDVVVGVPDPEMPQVTLGDLGIVRSVAHAGTGVEVTITPTYSGCPAMGTIRADITAALRAAGYRDVTVRTALSPAWTTDWMTEAGKRKLEDYGIAPPQARSDAIRGPIPVTLGVKCPRCHSLHTREVAKFGSTSCKALYQCQKCLEPFDYFKIH